MGRIQFTTLEQEFPMRNIFGLIMMLVLCSSLLAGTTDMVKYSAERTVKYSGEALQSVVDPLPPVGTRLHNTLDEVILSESFDSLREGQLPCGWTAVSTDEGLNAEVFGGNATKWRNVSRTGYAGRSAPGICLNAYNADGSANDDWLILPPFPPLTGAIALTYWIASQQAAYLESYEVRVATAGSDPANFTNLVYTGTNIPATFTQHAHDLSAYAGAPFWVAIHHTSTDKFVIKLDDVLLTGTYSPSASPCTITGIITENQTHAPVANAKVSLDGQVYTAYTSATGAYRMTLLPPASFTATVIGDYFTPSTGNPVVTTAGNTTTFSTELAVPAITEHSFVSTGGNVDIVDLEIATKPIEVTDNVRISDLDVTVNIVHTYMSDLSIWLVSPSGKRIYLEGRVGGNGQNMTTCRFDDEAANGIGLATAPFTGSYRPFYALNELDGDSTAGTWNLEVLDGAEGDVGTIGNVILNVKSGNTSPVSEPRLSVLPTSLAFHGNYPNPFNSRTDFRFDLAQSGFVTLALYNTLGQEVARVVNGRMDAGVHSVNYDAAGLSSGVYVARLSVNGGAALSSKVVLLK
jgi:subtilisin-like proprotein convertase family protein